MPLNPYEANPYEAPQTVPPPDPRRWRRWFGTFVVMMSVFFALISLGQFSVFYLFHANNELWIAACCTLVLAALFWFAGQYFRKTGRRPQADGEA